MTHDVLFFFNRAFSKENGISLNWKPPKWLFIDVITETLLWILIFEEALTALVKESAVVENGLRLDSATRSEKRLYCRSQYILCELTKRHLLPPYQRAEILASFSGESSC